MENGTGKTVLVVDDEKNLLESLKEGFKEHAGGFTIITAEFAGERGKLYFRNGELMDAETGKLSGDDAVCSLAA